VFSETPSHQAMNQRSSRRICLFLTLALCLCGLIACKREQRKFQQPPSTFKSYDITLSDIQPGVSLAAPPVKNPADERAYEVNEGKRLFTQYNCSGCHFNGGGGIGPPLMDQLWIYGDRPENIYATVVEGRPNGMPAFRQKIPDSQVWQIVAYVRSMSAQLRKDVAPSRNDDMSGRRSEQRTERKTPEKSGLPPSAQRP
jgi:cytochrome c oxidase cbb3-type subunit III